MILPAYNEEILIEKNTLKIKAEFDKIGKKYEILIVEESNDKTPEISEKLAKKHKEIIHFHSDKRLGKGGAIEKGIEISKGNKIIFMDIDLSTSLDITKEVIEKLEKYDIVITSRYNKKAKIKRSFTRSFAGWGFSFLARLILRTNLKDTKCGYKAFRKDVVEKIIKFVDNKGWFWDTELMIYAERMGYSINEMPISWYERKEGNVKIFSNTLDMMSNLLRLRFKITGKKFTKN